MTRSSGFTVIELLVVSAILAVLAAILFPAFTAARRSAYGAECVSNMRQLAIATLLYSADSDDVIPYAADPIVKGELTSSPTCFTDNQKASLAEMPSLKGALTHYGLQSDMWRCSLDRIDPLLADGRTDTWWNQDGSSYVFDDIDALTSSSLSTMGDLSERLLATDMEAFHGGGNMAVVDEVMASGRSTCVFFDGHARPASPATVRNWVVIEGCWF